MSRTARSQASMPTDKKKPLAWQMAELEPEALPLMSSMVGRITSHSVLSISLRMSMIIRLAHISSILGKVDMLICGFLTYL